VFDARVFSGGGLFSGLEIRSVWKTYYIPDCERHCILIQSVMNRAVVFWTSLSGICDFLLIAFLKICNFNLMIALFLES
jgi:hypothetical protein